MAEWTESPVEVSEKSLQRLGRPAPRHFHLLWDEDLDDLQPLLTTIVDRRSEVVGEWYQLYVLHFAEDASMSEAEFRRTFEPALAFNEAALVNKDMDRFANSVGRLGEVLAEKRVPLQELIASLHLFEEAAHKILAEHNEPLSVHLYTLFDKLSHIRIFLLVDAYFRVHDALREVRIGALEREAARLAPAARRNFHGLVGTSPSMQALYDRIAAAGRTTGTILIVGESGTGKELVARAIRECGPMAAAPFVALNCAALPKDLIESELFGYKRGAFSGAVADYPGLFRAAEGGTLFLDEITEMSAETQSKLLRAIQEKAIRPVGTLREIPVNVRLIASTNRDPEEAIKEGRLRQDLYYRLQASVLQIPPLRERKSDVPLLVDHFIELFNQRMTRSESVVGIGPAALEAMIRYDWPGNVRELSNVIESSFTFGSSPRIELEDLPSAVSQVVPTAPAPAPKVAARPATFADVERDVVRRALENAGGNKTEAARLLNISRKKLYAKIAKYGLT